MGNSREVNKNLQKIKTSKVKMALTSRLASHTCMLRPHGGMKLVLPSSTMSSIKAISPQEHEISREEYWEKNKRLNRPLSPHLTIYKPQMTSMLSITHRGTGVAWSLILSPVTFPTGLAALQSLQIGTPLIFIVKYGLSWMVCYHTINGLRHLAWDLGYGFTMPELYKTGYTVLGLSTILALAIACL